MVRLGQGSTVVAMSSVCMFRPRVRAADAHPVFRATAIHSAVAAFIAVVLVLACGAVPSGAASPGGGRGTVLDVAPGPRPVITFASRDRVVRAARVPGARVGRVVRGMGIRYRLTAVGRVAGVEIARRRVRAVRFTASVEHPEGRRPRLRLTNRLSLRIRPRHRVLRQGQRLPRRAMPDGARARVTWRLAGRRGRVRKAIIRLETPAAPAVAPAQPETTDGQHAQDAAVPVPAQQTGGASATPEASAAGQHLYWGAIVDGLAPTTGNMAPGGAFDRFERRAGKQLSMLQWGQPWKSGGTFQPFQRAYAENVRRHGAIPVINWCSWDLGRGAEQPDFQLRDITAGTYDAYVRRWAQDAKAWGRPLMLRFNHEMNGWWYPWGEGRTSTGAVVNGNAPGDFARAWRHVHAIFEQVGASNVTWLWSPNITATSSRYPAMASLYPGSDAVDWTGLSVYAKAGQWESPAALLTGAGTTYLDDSYGAVLDVAPDKPMVLAETGASETGDGGTRKAAWIRDLLGTQLLGRFPQVRAFIWFDWSEAGFETMPIASSQAAQQAFAEGIRSPLYLANTLGALSASPIPPPAP